MKPRVESDETGAKEIYVDQGAGNSGEPAGKAKSLPADPVTDLQKFAKESTGELLPIFGRDLFHDAPTTFAPADEVPVLPEYVIGPGDEVLLRIWGHDNFNGHLTVDRTGTIYIPHLGGVHVAGQRVGDLESLLQRELARTYRNFDFSFSLGHLRSIKIFVLGQAMVPGAFTVSSLSTAFTALLASGGPSVQGSMRNIEVRRAGVTIGHVDFYDFALRGDKATDLPLQSGDILFIPFTGPQVALAGSVRHPAIYEVQPGAALSEALIFAGGLTPTALRTQVTLDRVAAGVGRRTMAISLDPAGLATKLSDGDILDASPLPAAYKDAVTIRGNVANTGRFPWHAGMKLSEIIPDRQSLLTSNYWRVRNELGVPTPVFEPLADNGHGVHEGTLPSAGEQAGRADLAEQQQAATDRLMSSNSRTVAIVMPAPEIDWTYAVIERLDPATLRNSLISFNLGRLVNDHDAAEDKILAPGDVVTILSQGDVHVAIDQQTKYVHLEGEFASAGTYSAGQDETLADVVRRAGGLSSKAYLFGAAFTRESARVLQQQRMEEYISGFAMQLQRAGLSSGNPALASGQVALLEQMRRMRATGRIVLELKEDSNAASVPAIPLENGDIFRVPSRPLVVSVIGAVSGQNVLLFDPARRLAGYIQLAGKPTRVADRKRAFLIRADGSILSGDHAHGVYGGLEEMPIYPGDTIVIPEKPIKYSSFRGVIDWPQMLSSVAASSATAGVVR